MRVLKSDFLLGMIVGSGLLAAGMLLGGASATRGSNSNSDTAAMAAGDSAPSDLVRARRIEIVDEVGTVLLALGTNKDGGSVSVRDRFGKTTLLASATEHGGTLLLTETRTGRPAFLVSATSEGGRSTLFSENGHAAMDIRTTADVTTLAVADPQNRPGLVIKAGSDGGSLAAYSEAGAVYARLFADISSGGVIETYEANGEPLVSISSTVGGHGQISTFASPGKPMVSLTATANHEGHIYTYNLQGQPLVAIASNPLGPTLRVFNSDGEAAVTLESNENGHGTVGVWRRDGTGRALTP